MVAAEKTSRKPSTMAPLLLLLHVVVVIAAMADLGDPWRSGNDPIPPP